MIRRPIPAVLSWCVTGLFLLSVYSCGGNDSPTTPCEPEYAIKWSLENPLFVCETFFAVCHASDQTAIAVGSKGIISRTTDGGITWSKSHYSDFLADVSFVNKNNGIAAGDHIIRTTNGGVSWTKTYSSADIINGVAFMNVDTAFAVGSNGIILMTPNSGASWIEQDSVTAENLKGVSFSETGVGLIVGGNTILRSTDRGATWSAVPAIPGASLVDVEFVGNEKTIAVGNCILQSTDGGLNWSFAIPGTGLNLFDVDFSGANYGVAVGRGGNTLRTTNGGVSWQSIPLQMGRGSELRGVSLAHDDTGVIVGVSEISYVGLIWRTADRGGTWVVQTEEPVTDENLFSVHFGDPNIGSIVGAAGVVLYTADGGRTWTKGQSGTNDGLRDVFMIDRSTGISVGYNGVICRSTDGGANWTRLPGVTGNHLRGVSFWDDSNGVIVGASGTVLLTVDGGRNWTPKSVDAGYDLMDVCAVGTNVAVAVGSSILRTVDGGTTWGDQPNPASQTLWCVSSPDVNTSYAAGYNTFLFTTTGGNEWESRGNIGGNDVHFVDINYGFMVGERGGVVTTTNGGIEWIEHYPAFNNLCPTRQKMWGVCLTGKMSGIVVGDNGIVMRASQKELPCW